MKLYTISCMFIGILIYKLIIFSFAWNQENIAISLFCLVVMFQIAYGAHRKIVWRHYEKP